MFLAFSAKPFSISPEEVQQHQSQDKQHVASLLGGISMGIAACTCIGLAGFRMMETLAKADDLPGARGRMQLILRAREKKGQRHRMSSSSPFCDQLQGQLDPEGVCEKCAASPSSEEEAHTRRGI